MISTSANAQTANLTLGSPVLTSQDVSFAAVWTPGSTGSAGALQFAVNYSSTAFAGVSVTAGPAASAAGKPIYCATASGTVTCIIVGANVNKLQTGVVAQLSFSILPDATGPRTISLVSALAASLTADPISVTVSPQPLTTQAQPRISWPAPASIVAGTPLTSIQLDATANVPGSFRYSPGLGTVLPVGLQTLSTTFTPTDLTNYAPATAAAVIAVTASPGTTTKPTSLTCAPASLGPNAFSTCTVTLNQAAPPGGVSIILTHTNSALTMPSSVSVPAGSTTGIFTATTGSLSSSQTATITASLNGSSQSVIVSLLATPTLLTSLTCNTSRFLVGVPATCTVTLSNSAGGLTVGIASSNGAISVPASVTVPLNASSATFAATAQTYSPGLIILWASFNSLTRAALVSISPPENSQSSSLHGVSCTPKTIGSGSQGLCRIDLTGISTNSVVELGLSSSTDSLKLPPKVVTRPGQWSVEFQVEAVASGTDRFVTVMAQLGSNKIAESLEIKTGQSPSLDVPRHLIANKQEGGTVTEHVLIDPDGGAPAAATVVNAATRSQDAVCSPGALASLEGRWLAGGSAVSDPSGSSLRLAGTSVTINGDLVPILYASPRRVDFQCPVSAPGTKLSIVVETTRGATRPLETVVRDLAPGIFSADGSGAGQGVVMHAGSATLAMVPNYRYTAQAAQNGDHLVVHATGIEGAMGIFVNIGGIEVTPSSVTLIPGYAGVSEVSFTVPQSVLHGNAISLFLRGQLWDGTFVSSNITTIAIARDER